MSTSTVGGRLPAESLSMPAPSGFSLETSYPRTDKTKSYLCDEIICMQANLVSFVKFTNTV